MTASGEICPPLVVFPYKRLKQSVVTESARWAPPVNSLGPWQNESSFRLSHIVAPLALTAGAILGVGTVGYLCYRAVKYCTSPPCFGQPISCTTQKAIAQLTPLIANGTARVLPQLTTHYISWSWDRWKRVIERYCTTKMGLQCCLREDVFWHKISQIAIDEEKQYTVLPQFALAVLTLPHSNADTERIFSKNNLTKTKIRNKLSIIS